MERPTSNAVMIGVVLMALAAVIGLFWGVFTLSKTTINDGTTNVQEKIMQFEDLNWETYDDKEVLGREILSLHTTSTYDDIAILVHTVRMNDGVVISKDNDRYVQFYKGEPYVNYGAILGVLGTDRIEDMNEYLLEKGTAVRKSEDSLEQKAGAIYTDAVLCRDDLGYVTKDDSVTALKRDGTIEYINEKTTFDSMLIYDVSGAVVGVLFRQQENN
jgi:adenosylcobinamide amidohydrolase